MTDTRLRELERRAIETQDPADRARWIRAREHQGSLPALPCRECLGAGVWCSTHGIEAGTACIHEECGPGDCWACGGTGRLRDVATVGLLAFCGDVGGVALAGGCPSCAGLRNGDGIVQPGGAWVPSKESYAQACFSCGTIRRWPRRRSQLLPWLRCLFDFGFAVSVRSGLVAAQMLLHHAEGKAGDSARKLMALRAHRTIVHSVKRWLDHPLDSHVTEAFEASRRLQPGGRLRWALYLVDGLVQGRGGEHATLKSWVGSRELMIDTVQHAASVVGAGHVAAVIRTALIARATSDREMMEF